MALQCRQGLKGSERQGKPCSPDIRALGLQEAAPATGAGLLGMRGNMCQEVLEHRQAGHGPPVTRHASNGLQPLNGQRVRVGIRHERCGAAPVRCYHCSKRGRYLRARLSKALLFEC